ncbi:MAG: HD domain-containing protein [Bdellovibrionales bacterium]|nr:HD domain-containing protein [Bdellovibrionales bacterium]
MRPFKITEVRDAIHGSVGLYPWELAVVDSRAFQRLRNIKQLGFSEFAYPCAVHNRYVHSLGACHLAGRVFQSVFREHFFSSVEVYHRFLYLIRVTALLHDVGHGPFSHAVESAMPEVAELGLSEEIAGKKKKRQATHEDYTLKIVLDSSLTPVLEKGLRDFGITPRHVACVMSPTIAEKDGLFVDNGVNWRRILHQIVSSEIDVDRMDYLQRDSYFTGVSYGKFDFNWLLSNVGFHVVDKEAHLALSDRAIYTFEDFLLSRYHMFLMVYLHHKSVGYEETMNRYIRECSFRVPAEVEKYLDLDDAVFYEHLRRDRKNEWARRILERRIYKLALEVSTSDAGDPAVDARVKTLVDRCRRGGVDHFLVPSSGALSKYIRPNLGAALSGESTIYVAANDRMNEVRHVPLERYTDLFSKYTEARKIVRVYVPEDFSGGRE